MPNKRCRCKETGTYNGELIVVTVLAGTDETICEGLRGSIFVNGRKAPYQRPNRLVL